MTALAALPQTDLRGTPLLRFVLDLITEHPEIHDQNLWFSQLYGDETFKALGAWRPGDRACLGGLAVLVTGHRFGAFGIVEGLGYVHEAAAKLCGLDVFEADYLFHCDRALWQIQEFIERKEIEEAAQARKHVRLELVA